MVGETLSIARREQAALSSHVSALEAEITHLEHELDEAGENEGLFNPEIAGLIMRYSKAITALKTTTCQQATSHEVQVIEAEVFKLEQELEEIGDGEYLFDPTTAALIRYYIRALATRETARRQQELSSQTDLLKDEIARLEEELDEAAAIEGLFDAKVAALILRCARAVAAPGDVSYCP